VFVLHVLEEAPWFVEWFNSLVAPPISQSSFLSVNAVALVVTLAAAALVYDAREPVSGLIGAAWVGFVMLANGLFHIVATVALGRYCPGVVTGVLLYLPLSFSYLRAVVRELGVSPPAAVAAALIGGAPMYIHGYLIVFRGSRLF
jgi:hypothetical protein